jgi:hypothetical protein
MMAFMKVNAIFANTLKIVGPIMFGFTAGLMTGAAAMWAQGETYANLVIGALGALIAASATGGAVWAVYSQRVIARRQATVQHVARLDADAVVRETLSQFIALTKDTKNLAHWADEDKVGSSQALTIIFVLNQFELIGTAIQLGIFEYEFIERWQKNSIIRYWRAAHPFVVALRQRVDVATLWIEFETLNNWVSGRSNPRRALWWTGFA